MMVTMMVLIMLNDDDVGDVVGDDDDDVVVKGHCGDDHDRPGDENYAEGGTRMKTLRLRRRG